MKYPKLLVGAVTLFATLTLYACAPGPHGGPGGERLSPNELFTNADSNSDGMLSQEEFTKALPH